MPAHASCDRCAWFYVGGRGRKVARCRVHDGVRVTPGQAACAQFEPPLDCQLCAACCREAYHSVTVGPRDPLVRAHPELIETRATYVEMRRAFGRCAALSGPAGGPFACTIYEERARCCREFTAGGAHCLEARRRVRLSV